MRHYADRYVRKALSEKRCGPTPQREKYQNFLQSFTEQTDSHDEIKNGLLNLLVAGRDTSASLLTNLWFLLSKHEKVWKRLQTEIASLNGAPPDADTLKSMPYLRHCIDECKQTHESEMCSETELTIN